MAASWFQGDGDVQAQLLEALQPHVLVRIFVPSRDRDNRPLPLRVLGREMEEHLINLTGGVTSLPAFGAWRDEQGRIVRERVRVIETYWPDGLDCHHRQQLLAACFSLAQQTHQVCVAVAVDPGQMYLLSSQDALAFG
jgi:hypothetical protein